MSTVCRYFLRGTCRFGDNCRFSHTVYDSNDEYEYEDQYESHDSSQNYYGRQSKSYSYDQERYSRYDQHSSGGRYNENQRSSAFNKSYSHSDDRYDTYNQRYDSPAKSYQTSEKYNDYKYGQNRFRWLSPDYNREVNDEETHGYQKQTNLKPSLLSTPKEKVSFSFNSAISEIKSDSSTKESNFRISNETKKYSELVAEETRIWEKGQQWPFSCFCPFLDKSNLPSFVDLSPEELRFQAYKAKDNNTYGAYISSVDAALLEVVKKRTQYKQQEPEVLAIIERVQKGEQFRPGDSVSPVFGHLMGYGYSESSEPMHHEMMPSSVKSSASTFRFVLPNDETTKTSSTSEDDSTYTSIDRLSQSEKEQFQSSTFTLGKVPTKPPPRVLCS